MRTAFAGIGAAALALAAIAAAEILVRFPDAPGPGAGALREVVVEAGAGPRRLAETLAQAGLLSSPNRFILWMRATGQLRRVRAGRFLIPDNLSAAEIIERLASRGIDKGVRMTVPEGYTLRQIAEAAAGAGIADAPELLALATDPALVARLRMPGPTAEGYLFPDTYFLDPAKGALGVIEAMHGNFRAHVAELGAAGRNDLRQIVTLASIVQKEARAPDEIGLVAGVYANRLRKPGFSPRLLQADPTVSYGCEPFVQPQAASCRDFRGVLRRAQLDDPDNPYNTYRRPGLPPGPICSPGRDALKAALAPAETPYFYFVLDEAGRHAFSATLEEHQKAVARYRQSQRSGETAPSRPE